MGTWRPWNPQTLLVEMENGTSQEKSLSGSYKINFDNLDKERKKLPSTAIL